MADEAQRNGSIVNRWAIGILISINLLAWSSLYGLIADLGSRLIVVESTSYTTKDRAVDLATIADELRQISARMATKEDVAKLPPEWLTTLVRDNAARIRELERKR